MSIPRGTDAANPSIAPGPSRTAYVGLGVAAVVLGVATAVGVWLFNQAFGLVHRVVFDGVADALAPLGAWTLIPIVAAAGVVVAVIVRFMRPEPLGALPHVIDGVVEHEGRLNGHNAAVAIGGAAAGIGFGMPLGADTPSAMIGAHLASSVATRLRWPTAFVQALVVAGVAAGISSTFLAQLAAVVFAFEVVLGGFGGIVFVAPTLIAVGVAGFVTYELVGTPATYPVPLPAIHWDATLLLYLAPAILAGLAAIAYVTFLQRSKPLWARVPLPPMGRMVGRGCARRPRRDLAARGHGHGDGDDEGPVRRRDHPAGDPARARRGRDHPDPGQPRCRASSAGSSARRCSSARRSGPPSGRSSSRSSRTSGCRRSCSRWSGRRRCSPGASMPRSSGP